MAAEFPPPGPAEDAAGALLDRVLEPLLDDFAASFERGFVLLDACPESVLPLERQQRLLGRLEEARRELAAARALRAAARRARALAMAALRPWHELVVEVWSLSAAMRAAGLRP
jgi:hypothetical protein